MFEDNKNLYPTPMKIAKLMYDKLTYEEQHCLRNILEPSAGTAQLIDNFKAIYKEKNHRNFGFYNSKNKVEDYLKFDAIEYDERLYNLLKGKGINVIDRDFLTHEPQNFYGLIIMNPPYDNGTKHLLKAISIQERIGGKIICLLNAESLKNPYSNDRKHLLRLLEQYHADIEYIDNAFSDAERQTNVEIALISVNIPMTDKTTMFERDFKRDHPEVEFDTFQSLIPNMTKLETLVFEYDIIKKSAIELFKEKKRIDLMLSGMKLKSNLTIADDHCKATVLTINSFIENLNFEYWNKFINETSFRDRLPSKLRNTFTCNMDRQRDITFNMESVRYFYEELTKSIPESYEKTVTQVFNNITQKYCYSDTDFNKSIHYYDGWCANQGMKINKKCIIKCYHEYMYRVPDDLNDLNIIFENISGLKDNINDGERVAKAIKNCEKKIETKFFIMDSYKKQTLHITFKNQDYLNQFNLLAGKGSNALPPDFGQKSYSDMNEEEKTLVEEFGLTPIEYHKLSGGKDYLKLA